jgi:hypothetical protein
MRSIDLLNFTLTLLANALAEKKCRTGRLRGKLRHSSVTFFLSTTIRPAVLSRWYCKVRLPPKSNDRQIDHFRCASLDRSGTKCNRNSQDFWTPKQNCLQRQSCELLADGKHSWRPLNQKIDCGRFGVHFSKLFIQTLSRSKVRQR